MLVIAMAAACTASDNSMQRTAIRAAADAERYTENDADA